MTISWQMWVETMDYTNGVVELEERESIYMWYHRCSDTAAGQPSNGFDSMGIPLEAGTLCNLAHKDIVLQAPNHPLDPAFNKAPAKAPVTPEEAKQ